MSKLILPVYIDGENFPASRWGAVHNHIKGKIGDAVQEVKLYGQADLLRSWIPVAQELDRDKNVRFHLIDTPHNSKGKNHADIQMILSIYEDILEKGYQNIHLVSSDSDFSPLVGKVKARGLSIYGFGSKDSIRNRIGFRQEYAELFTRFYSVDEQNLLTKHKKVDPRTLGLSNELCRSFLTVAAILKKNERLDEWVATASFASMAASESFGPGELGRRHWRQVISSLSHALECVESMSLPKDHLQRRLFKMDSKGVSELAASIALIKPDVVGAHPLSKVVLKGGAR